MNFFLPTIKKNQQRCTYFYPEKTYVWTFANLSFWRSESLLKFNAIGRASTKSLRSMQTVGKSGKKKDLNTTPKRRAAHFWAIRSSHSSTICLKSARALTQIHNQSTDTVKQWVFVSLQYTFRREGTERKMENSWFVFVDITFGEFERTKSILKINYIFTVKWAAKINGKEMDWLRLRIAREKKRIKLTTILNKNP